MKLGLFRQIFEKTSISNFMKILPVGAVFFFGTDGLTDIHIFFFNLKFMGPCIVNVFLSTTNETQEYTIFFIVVSALHVSSGFYANHQEL
jgi:hypothetical protein